MKEITAENKKWSVCCTNTGVIEVEHKIDKNKSFTLELFGDRYQYLYTKWDIVPEIYLSPVSEYIIVTYGIGYIYFINPSEKRVIKRFQLFSDINYEDDSFQSVDLCCYYMQWTRIDFSNTGRYAAVRVRGDYDPQEGDGRSNVFTPVYFRSIFLIDLLRLEVCLQEDYSDVPERGGRNLASIAFSPNDDYLVTGALGNEVKVFRLQDKACIGRFFYLVWNGDPLGIQNCPLIVFMDENNFIYVNSKKDIIRVTLQKNHKFTETGIIKTGVPEDHEISKGVYDKYSDIYQIELQQNELTCYLSGNRKEYRGPVKYKLQFEDKLE